MKYLYFLFVNLGFSAILFGQNAALDTISVDDKYREDQFYVAITYNLLGNKPNDVSQNGFSSGFHIGFIRDMPI